MTRLRRIPRFSAILPLVTGVTALAGGLTLADPVASALPLFAPVGLNTALACVLAGLALCLAPSRRRPALFCALAVCFLAMLPQLQSWLRWYPVTGPAIFLNPPAPGSGWPGRMCLLTSLGLLGAGFTLLLLLQRWRPGMAACLLALPASALPAFLGTGGIVSILLGSDLFHAHGSIPGIMALFTAVSLLALGCGTQIMILFHPCAQAWFQGRIDRQIFASALVLLFFSSMTASLGVTLLLPHEHVHNSAGLVLQEMLDSLLLPLPVSLGGALLLACWIQPLLRELEDTRSRLVELLRHLPDSVVTVHESGLIETANPAALQLFGYELPEMHGLDVELLMDPSCASQHLEAMRRYLTTGVSRIIGKAPREVLGRHRDGWDQASWK